ncbi:MAG: carbon-nitrogen hydrolase family protein [Bacilli bacterium]|nr:carbon-nitrogen hydrolase family protein [Bacilli bacterium]
MNDNFKVAILQLNAINNPDESLAKGIDACKKAKEMGADIAVFPEMWNVGYGMPDNDENINAWIQKSISENSDYILKFKELAKQLNMAIAITFLEKTKNLPKNSIIIYDRFGNEILKYSKVHTVDFKMEKYTKPGTDFYVGELDYERGKVNIGSMICFDRDFPESARILMLKGAEIILVPNACLMTKIRLEQLKVRAYENMVGIVTVNYANYMGKSSAFSPIVRDDNDSQILVMDEKEDIQIVKFNLNEIRDYRKRETLGDAYRKPSLYKYLSEEHIKEPFIRADSRRNLK